MNVGLYLFVFNFRKKRYDHKDSIVNYFMFSALTNYDIKNHIHVCSCLQLLSTLHRHCYRRDRSHAMGFLAATKQLYEWFSPSVCLSVCGGFLRWWPPSTMWAGPLIYIYCHHRGCLNNPIFLNLGLCAAC